MESKNIGKLGNFVLDRGFVTKKINIGIFGGFYEINLSFRVYENGFEGITPELISKSSIYLENIDSEMDKVMHAIMEYYQTEVREMAEEEDCDYIVMEHINELEQVVIPKELFFTVVNIRRPNAYIKYGMVFDCDWTDDGLAVSYGEDGNIKEVGTIDILY